MSPKQLLVRHAGDRSICGTSRLLVLARNNRPKILNQPEERIGRNPSDAVVAIVLIPTVKSEVLFHRMGTCSSFVSQSSPPLF